MLAASLPLGNSRPQVDYWPYNFPKRYKTSQHLKFNDEIEYDLDSFIFRKMVIRMNFVKLHSQVLELLDKYFNGLEMRSIKIKRIAERIFSQGPDIRLLQYDGGLHLQPSLPSSSIQNFHVISSSCGIILDASKDNDF